MVIASDTAPVREVVNDKNGLLVPFFDIEQLANCVIRFSLILRCFARFEFKHARPFLTNTT